MTRPASQNDTPPSGVEACAAWWRVNRKTFLRHRDKGLDWMNVEAVMAWFEEVEDHLRPAGLVAKIAELKGEPEPKESSAIPGESDPDWAAFNAQVRTEDPKDAMAKIAKARDWAFFKFELASKNQDKKLEKHYGDMLAKMEGVLHDAQLRAKKLGVDSGDLFPREQIERDDAALAAALFRSIDTAMPGLCRELLGINHPEAIRAKLEPVLLDVAFLRPMAEAVRLASDQSLPAWRVENFMQSAATYIESGRDELNKLLQPATLVEGEGI
jgi:hypothetical protein